MDGKRTVFSVSSGEYSGYYVSELFEDRDDAEAVAARLGRGFFVEEFDLYPPGTRVLREPRRRWSATALVNGDGRILEHVTVYDHCEFYDADPQPSSVTHRTVWPIRVNGEPAPERVGQPYEVHAIADTEDQARKVVREQAGKVASILIDGGTPETPW